MEKFDKTDFLTPKSSFVIGMGSCINLGGNYFAYNVSRSPTMADENAIHMDWKIAGNDLRGVMNGVLSSPNDTQIGLIRQ